MLMSDSVLQFGFPFRIGANGSPVRVTDLRHAEDMIEQLLFTGIGERVNRPTFGCAIATYVFEPASAEMLAALKALVHSALQTWLGDVISVQDLGIQFEQETLTITIDFTLLSNRQRARATFVR
jgi:uncharacterized protein